MGYVWANLVACPLQVSVVSSLAWLASEQWAIPDGEPRGLSESPFEETCIIVCTLSVSI